jgi:hypothetical protein
MSVIIKTPQRHKTPHLSTLKDRFSSKKNNIIRFMMLFCQHHKSDYGKILMMALIAW